jgi:hypothetical protein
VQSCELTKQATAFQRTSAYVVTYSGDMRQSQFVALINALSTASSKLAVALLLLIQEVAASNPRSAAG